MARALLALRKLSTPTLYNVSTALQDKGIKSYTAILKYIELEIDKYNCVLTYDFHEDAYIRLNETYLIVWKLDKGLGYL